MSEVLAREIVGTAREIEKDEMKQQAFATLLRRSGTTHPWEVKLPTHSMVRSSGYLSDALACLAKNGFYVDLSKIKASVDSSKANGENFQMIFSSASKDVLVL